MASRKIEDLRPIVAGKAKAMIDDLAGQGIEVMLTSTLRTMEEQAKLYAIGRTVAGKKVTNADAGQSWHNYGLAFDVVPIVHGKAVWDSQHWAIIGLAGKKQDLIWGGNFKSFKDMPHFEYHPNMTLAEAKTRWSENKELLT